MGTFMRTMMMMSSTHNHMMSLCGQTLDALVTHAKAGDIGTDDALVLMRATQHCMEAHKAAVDAQLGEAIRELERLERREPSSRPLKRARAPEPCASCASCAESTTGT